MVLIALAALSATGTAQATTIQVETTAESVFADSDLLAARSRAVGQHELAGRRLRAGAGEPGHRHDFSLAAGNYQVLAGELVLDPSGTNGDVTLQGVGAGAVALDHIGIAASRLIRVVQSSETVTITGVTIRNGNTAGIGGDTNGGGILSASSLELLGTRIVNNSTARSTAWVEASPFTRAHP